MKLMHGVAWSALRGWGSRAINFAVFFISARYLSPSDLGVFSLVAAYLMILQVLGEGGLADFIVQRNEDNARQDSVIFYAQLANSFTLALLLLATTPWLAPKLIAHPDAILIFIACAVTIPITAAVRVPEAILKRNLRFKALAYRGLIMSALAGMVAVVLAYRGFGVWALVIKTLAEVLIDGIAIFMASRWLPVRVTRADLPLLKQPYAYGKHLIGARLTDTLYQRIDIFLIGHFVGNSALGYYSVGQKIYQALLEVLSRVFANVAVPYMAREKKNPLEVRRVYYEFVQLVAMVGLPIFVYIFLFAHETIVMLFGPVWVEAAWILQAFCVLGAVNCIAFFNGHVLMAMGDSKAFFGVLLKKTLILVVLCLIGVNFALPGIVIAVVAAGVLAVPLSYRRMQRWIDVDIKGLGKALTKGILLAAIAGTVVACAKLFLSQNTSITKMVFSSCSFAIIIAAMYVLMNRKKLSM
ncbi:MAG TPA: lipopolysaccharide biosynthesis protein [Spongiibacteraceae bacterium]